MQNVCAPKRNTTVEPKTKRNLLATASALGLAAALVLGAGSAFAAAKIKNIDAEEPSKISKQKHKTSKERNNRDKLGRDKFGKEKLGKEKFSREKFGKDKIGKDPFGSIPKGPLHIMISINQQKLHLYSNGTHIADAPISTGVPEHPTPIGVFSVIEKDRYHRSNIYSAAPMPYMQRITWSGVAIHEGVLPGHPASHGCVRMPHDFATRLWVLTRLGARVIIARNELAPVAFADAHLFVHKDKPPAPVAGEPVKSVRTAQAFDTATATDAVATSTQQTAASASGSLAPVSELRGALIEAGAAAAAGAAGATEADEVVPAAKARATEIDPALIAEAKELAFGAAAGDETGAPAAADAEPTTGVVSSPAPVMKVEAPAKVEVPVVPKIVEVKPPASPEIKAEPAKVAEPATPKKARDDLTITAPAPAIAAKAQNLTIVAPEEVPLPPAKPEQLLRAAKAKPAPIAIFISRKEGKIYVRRNFEPLFDAAITIKHPEQPLGTHVFTAMDLLDDGTTFRWTAVSMPGEPPKAAKPAKSVQDEKHAKGKHHRNEPAPKPPADLKPPQDAHQALARIEIPQETLDHISELMVPGSTLIVSDQGLGLETGRGTDFIVVTR